MPVANHHGDLCFHHGMLYVAVNRGKFNDPEGNADTWVCVHDAESLRELARHETQQVFHGAGGIGSRDGHFFVVDGLPDGAEENDVYEYDNKFKFQKKHVIRSGHTHPEMTSDICGAWRGKVVATDAKAAVKRSTGRSIAWLQG